MVEKKTVKRGRKWVGVMYTCCHVYGRAYMNDQNTAYLGQCAKCGKRLMSKISKHAPKGNFFTAG
jgi:hypothetical protein